MFRLQRVRSLGCAMLFGISCWNMPAQASLPNFNATCSVSGQFVITRDRSGPPTGTLFVNPPTNSVRLDPALLAVSAERIKQRLWRELGIDPRTQWSGKIFITLHPAQSPDENVTIVSEHFANGWDYRVAFPDVLSSTRFLRAMTSVILLEFANRGDGEHPADIPSWLTDGLSQALLATGAVEIVLSSPVKTVNGLLESRTDVMRKGIDPLADARRLLADHSVLTFEQLSWPTGKQLSGDDGGVYRASAQLFVNELLKLENGPAQLSAMLQMLPRYYNWQTAFLRAFHSEFARPVDVEKWWELQIVAFMAHDPGPTWTPAMSRAKLDQILSVPVDFRAASNALPVHATVSLQAVIRNFDSSRRTTILETKLHDLELAQLRMAQSLAGLTAEYRNALAGYLGENRESRRTLWSKHPEPRNISANSTLQKLDALDAQRRTIESTIKSDMLRP